MYGRLVSFLIGSAFREQRMVALDKFEEEIQGEVSRDRILVGGSPDEPSRYVTICGNALMGCEARFRAPTNSVAFWLFGVPLVPTFLLLAASSAERVSPRALSEGSPIFSRADVVLGLLVAISALGVMAIIFIAIYWTLGVQPGVMRERYSLQEFTAMCEQRISERGARLPEAVQSAPWFQTALTNLDRVSIVGYVGRRTGIEFFTLCYLMRDGKSATIAVWYDSPSYPICKTAFPA